VIGVGCFAAKPISQTARKFDKLSASSALIVFVINVSISRQAA